MSDAFTQLVNAAEKATKTATAFVMFTPLLPTGFSGWLRPYRYEMHMTAIASSMEEVEEYKTWQLRAKHWQPHTPHKWMGREVAFLFAPTIPDLRDTEQLTQYLVMQYTLPSFAGYPRGFGWDAMVVWAEDEKEAFQNADLIGITPMRKPLTAVAVPVPRLPTVKDILTRPGIGYMQSGK